MKKIGAFYGRYSSDKQREESIEDQLRVCLQYAEREGIEIPEKYRFDDRGISGAMHKRIGLQRMMAALKDRPEIEYVIVDELSRLSRCDLQTLVTFYTLVSEDKILIAVSDGIDTRDSNAKMQIHLKALMNNMRLDELRKETKRGQIGQKLKGRSAGENVYGYTTVPDGQIVNKKGGPRPEGKRHVVYENEAKIVRLIFEEYNKGTSPNSIAKMLNISGLKAKKGGPWNSSTIGRLLRNERYIGIWKYNQSKTIYNQLTGTKRSVKRPKEEWHVEIREDLRIIPQDLWDSVQERLKLAIKPFPKKRGRGVRRASDGNNISYIHAYPKDPFDGLMECGVCGNSIVKVGGSRGGYLGCHHGRTEGCSNKVIVQKKYVDDKLIEVLLQEILRPEILGEIYKEVAQNVRNYKGDVPEKLKEVMQELNAVTTEIQNYVAFVQQGNASRTIGQLLEAAEKKENELNKQRTALKQAEEKTFKAPPREWVEHRLTKLKDLLRENPGEAAPMLRKLLGRLMFHPVYPDIGKPYYRITSKAQTLALLDESEGSDDVSNSMQWWRRRESNPHPRLLTY